MPIIKNAEPNKAPTRPIVMLLEIAVTATDSINTMIPTHIGMMPEGHLFVRVLMFTAEMSAVGTKMLPSLT